MTSSNKKLQGSHWICLFDSVYVFCFFRFVFFFEIFVCLFVCLFVFCFVWFFGGIFFSSFTKGHLTVSVCMLTHTSL